MIPTGTVQTRSDGTYLVLERQFAAPVAAVWAAVTESDRLGRWIGIWRGDPASGTVEFNMTAEGEDAGWQPMTIEICEEPTRLRLSTASLAEGPDWILDLALGEAAGRTTLTFAQVADGINVGEMAAGWEYYLDRLVAAEAGLPVDSIDWAEYEALMASYAEHAG